MLYKLSSDKSVRIPDKDIENFVEKLECSQEEAIALWLSDHDYISNDEQQALNEKAKKEVKVSNIIKAQSVKPKTQKERVQKPDEVKEDIISTIVQALAAKYDNVTATDARKLITFKVGEDEFKVNLTRTRKPKA